MEELVATVGLKFGCLLVGGTLIAVAATAPAQSCSDNGCGDVHTRTKVRVLCFQLPAVYFWLLQQKLYDHTCASHSNKLAIKGFGCKTGDAMR